MSLLGSILVTAFILGQVRSASDTDWREPKDDDGYSLYMSPPDDQYSCGNCYGFATAAAMEWFAANVTGKLIELSTQFYVDCMDNKYTGEPMNGCGGGIITDGLKYAMTYQYHPYKEDYEYTGYFNPMKCVENGVKARKARNALADVWVYDYIPLSSLDASGIRDALEKGPVIAAMYVSDDIYGWDPYGLVVDRKCVKDPLPHVMAIVGWQANKGDPYFIIRNSYGEFWGDEGYIKYADREENLWCNYHKNAYSLAFGRRRELEYKLGQGKKKFDDARAWCQALDDDEETNGEGWDLAVIPTQMHNFEVYDMFTDMYGQEAKKDLSFNFIWIGMFNKKWVDGTEAIYQKWDNNNFKYNFGVMKKVYPGTPIIRGRWTTKPKTDSYRFVCSRYRAEECPRISQTAVDEAETLTMYDSNNKITKEIEAGTTAVITCMEGYQRIGPAVSTCQSDGAWSELPTCVEPTHCKLLTKKDIGKSKSIKFSGKQTVPGFADEGSTMIVKCAKKHNLVKEDKKGATVCKGGKWQNMPSCIGKRKKSKRRKRL